MDNTPVKAWVCPVCGYIHYGAEPPEECPVCGAMGDLFEATTEAVPEHVEILPVKTNGTRKVVVVGAGIAGVSAAEALRKADGDAEIILISNESSLPYYRLNLTRYLDGEITSEQLIIHPDSWYTENGITLLNNIELKSIDLASRELILSDTHKVAFDKLVLTVGAFPFVPPIPGASKQNVGTLRTIKDADLLLEASRAGGRCVCIGGGLLGLEAAGALARKGMQVTVLESQPWPLPRQLNEHGGRLFQEQLRAMGIRILTLARTKELVGEDTVREVSLEDGTKIPADLVLISAGVRSNVSQARQAGLQVNQGVLVGNHQRTTHPDVYAAGDVAEHQGVVYGIWGPSQTQGTIAGLNAAGQAAEFHGMPRSNTLKVVGINLFSIGRIKPEDADLIIDGEVDGYYACFLFCEDILVGSILLGNTALSSKVKHAIEARLDWREEIVKKPSAKDLSVRLSAL